MPAAELAQEVARLNVALAMATAAPAAASPVAVEAASAPVSAASSVAATPAVTTVLSFPSAPALTLELALALGQLRNNGDLARALALLEPIARSTAPELQPWQPLARLLAARYLELRRLEDQLERQAQQLRDSQRRLDQTTEKLEALKNIERSLTVRPAAGSPGSATPPRTP